LEAFLLIENLPFLKKSVEALAAPDFSGSKIGAFVLAFLFYLP